MSELLALILMSPFAAEEPDVQLHFVRPPYLLTLVSEAHMIDYPGGFYSRSACISEGIMQLLAVQEYAGFVCEDRR